MINTQQVATYFLAQKSLPRQQALQMTMMSGGPSTLQFYASQQIISHIAETNEQAETAEATLEQAHNQIIQQQNKIALLTAQFEIENEKTPINDVALEMPPETAPEPVRPEQVEDLQLLRNEISVLKLSFRAEKNEHRKTDRKLKRRNGALERAGAKYQVLKEQYAALGKRNDVTANTVAEHIARVAELTEEVRCLEAQVTEISRSLIKPINRSEFDTETKFRNAAWTQVLLALEVIFETSPFELSRVETAFDSLADIPDELKEKCKTLALRHKEEIDALLGERLDSLLPVPPVQ